jgi:hypothetical protein
MIKFKRIFILLNLLVLVTYGVSNILDRISPLSKKSVTKPDNQTTNIVNEKPLVPIPIYKILEMLNQTKEELGGVGVKLDSRLTKSAQNYANQIPEMIRLHRADNLLKKFGLNNSTTKERMEEQGVIISDCKGFGELILAETTDDMSKFKNGIKGDEEALKNILSADMVGIGTNQVTCQEILDIGDRSWFKSVCQKESLEAILHIVVIDWTSLEVKCTCPKCPDLNVPPKCPDLSALSNLPRFIIIKPVCCNRCGSSSIASPSPKPQPKLEPVVTIVRDTVHETGITETYQGVTSPNQPIQLDPNGLKMFMTVEMKPVPENSDN